MKFRSETWHISKLKPWDKNPRDITPEDFERLKTQIRNLDQYKPVLVNEDGIVLGGNMRLRAFQDMNVEEVWVSVVHAPDEETMLKYALSDNDRAGYYLKDKLYELSLAHPELDLELYKVDLGNAVPLSDLSLFQSDDQSPEDLENYLEENKDKELLKILTTTDAARQIREAIETNRNGEADDGLVLLELIR